MVSSLFEGLNILLYRYLLYHIWIQGVHPKAQVQCLIENINIEVALITWHHIPTKSR